MFSLLRRTFEALASLKLTVTLFALAMFLIFAGTLAQVNQDIWLVMGLYFRTFIAWIDPHLFIPRQIMTIPFHVPFPGGFTLGGLMIINLLAAHWIRFRFSRRRIGIIMLHAGIIVLLLGEMLTALLAEEGQMVIYEGESANYVEDIREAELVVIRRDDLMLTASTDGEAHAPIQPRQHVIAIPEHKLTQPGRVIRHEQLPFDIRVEQWLVNSQLINVVPPDAPAHDHVHEHDHVHDPGPATHGVGLRLAARRLPRASGIDGSTVNAPSAYVELLRDDQSLGVWLVSMHLNPVQEIEVDGNRYIIDLRFKRTYKPYTIHLLEFRHDRFVGTERPRNFSSRLRLVNPQTHEDREVLIRMNHPLRYQGATFYQASYLQGDAGTVLQVVRNPGWLLPYLACALVGIGMIIHFVMHLTQFLRRPTT